MITWIKIFMSVNVFLFQKTNGRIGSRMGKQQILLLNNVGRKSGKTYATPMAYYRDGDSYLLVASNWGREDHPNWFYNLLQTPNTTIRVGPTNIPVATRQAEGEEYARLWDVITGQFTQYLKYQKGLARRIPIVVLTPRT